MMTLKTAVMLDKKNSCTKVNVQVWREEKKKADINICYRESDYEKIVRAFDEEPILASIKSLKGLVGNMTVKEVCNSRAIHEVAVLLLKMLRTRIEDEEKKEKERGPQLQDTAG